MRISGRQSDPNHWTNHFARCPDIFFNGELLHHVAEADDQEGWVVIEIWKDGKLQLESTGTCIAVRMLTGKVQIVDRGPGTQSAAAP